MAHAHLTASARAPSVGHRLACLSLIRHLRSAPGKSAAVCTRVCMCVCRVLAAFGCGRESEGQVHNDKALSRAARQPASLLDNFV
jgi:hypothetical protein